jgi:hypothetical protein
MKGTREHVKGRGWGTEGRMVRLSSCPVDMGAMHRD